MSDEDRGDAVERRVTSHNRRSGDTLPWWQRHAGQIITALVVAGPLFLALVNLYVRFDRAERSLIAHQKVVGTTPELQSRLLLVEREVKGNRLRLEVIRELQKTVDQLVIEVRHLRDDLKSDKKKEGG